jgi:hypothetical protein
MRRAHRTVHRALWPVLAVLVMIGLAAALWLRPPPKVESSASVLMHAQVSPFPSPHSRSEWRGGVRGGGLFSSPHASRANKERPPTRLASLATLPAARFARGGREGAR